MEEATKKKRASYYDPVAQAKYKKKNKEKTRRTTAKSVSKRFVTQDITLEEIEVFRQYLNDRENQLKEAL